MIEPLYEIRYLASEVFLSLFAMVLLILGVLQKKPATKTLTRVGALGLVAAIFLIPGLVGDVGNAAFAGAFAADTYARFAKLAIYLSAALALLLGTDFFLSEKLLRPEYVVLVLLSTVGMSLMVSASDLISVYLGVELQTLCVYIMATFNRDSRRSTEAGLKYFVLGALSSGFLLYGASLIYGFSGSTQFSVIAEASSSSQNPIGLTFGLVFFLSALAFKVSAAPFHMWTPDVYEGAPTPVTAFMAAAPKLAGMFLFGRVLMEAFPGVMDQWQPIIWLISAASMIIGSLSALVQTNIKRLMAYSSIGHMGYALIGLAAGSASGLTGMVTYMAIYTIMTIGVFACILMMRRPEGMAENISDLSGLSQTQPGLGLLFTAFFLSLAGIPPLLGFFAKFYVFLAAIEAGLFILVIVGVLTSVVSTFYYLSVLRTIWFAEPTSEFVNRHDPSLRLIAAGSGVIVSGGVVVLIGLLSTAAGVAASSLVSVTP